MTNQPTSAKLELSPRGTGPDVSTRKRGRPSADEIAFISSQILVAASRIFLEKPFGEVSIEAIAALAGVKKNTIYKRFPDKRAVLRAVLSERLARRVGEGPAWDPVGNLEDILKAAAAGILRQATSSDVRAWTRLAESAWPGHEGLEFRRNILGYDRAVDQIAQQIAQTGGQEIVNPRFVATALMSILTGWMDTTGQRPDIDDAELTGFAHAAVELVVRGCAAQ